MPQGNKIKNIVLAALLLALLTGCSIFSETQPEEAKPAVVIDDSVVRATGILQPETFAYLSVSVPGVIDAVLVQEGQIISADQDLITLDGLAQAQAGLDAAALELESAQQALDELQESADSARAAAWLAFLDARSQYNTAEAAWEALDLDEYQDDIDDAYEDVLEAEEDLEDAQENFDRYADLEEDNALRKRYAEDLAEVQEDYNEKVRIHAELIIQRDRLEAAWQAAQAAVTQAQADYEATRSGPDPDLLAMATARLTAAESQAEAAQTQVDNLTLNAPFAGTIAAVHARQGEYAVPGQPVVVLADLGSMRVETTDLNEIDVVRIAVGDTAVITFDALPGQEFEGIVTEISPKAADGLGVNYTVVIELAEIPGQARWGMTVFVDIAVEN